jgi:hypothetical protein
MSELIDRQQAIDALARTAREKFNLSDEYNHYLAGLMDGELAIKELPTIQPEALACGNGELIAKPEPQWISVTERLPDNADHPGAFCPRYQVVTPYGVTEGWYRPHDHEKGGQWFALFWFMSQIYEIWNIDFERGDVPKVIGEAPVMEWRPLPEPYKPNNK